MKNLNVARASDLLESLPENWKVITGTLEITSADEEAPSQTLTISWLKSEEPVVRKQPEWIYRDEIQLL